MRHQNPCSVSLNLSLTNSVVLNLELRFPLYKICQCPKINSLPTLSSLISTQHYKFSKSGGDFSAKSRWLRLLHTHWNFLSKFLSLYYYTTLEGVLGVQRIGQAQETITCLFGPQFFSQNGMTLKTYKKYQNPVKSYWFF